MSEHYVALLLEVSLDLSKLVLELRCLNTLSVHLFQEKTQKLAHVKNILECPQHRGNIKETLIRDRCKISIMQESYFLKITGTLNTINKFRPLALQNIDLKIGIHIVNEETHVLS